MANWSRRRVIARFLLAIVSGSGTVVLYLAEITSTTLLREHWNRMTNARVESHDG
jgi:hypothetical protein